MTTIQLHKDLFAKYNVAGPRYTSYPTAVQFTDLNGKEVDDYILHFNESPRKLSLYVHLPFCEKQCFYCGCTTVISKNKSASREYLDLLKKEIETESQRSHPKSVVHQLHYGGGTPTYFTPGELKELTLFLREKFNFDNDAECSIELDPRTVTIDHIKVLKEVGFNRASIGVQDVNEEVQVAINRIQPMPLNIAVMEMLREFGFESVNIDLIYGLPLQTISRFKNTLDAIAVLKPDRIALYSYAHVPWVKKNQRLIDEESLPKMEDKLSMMMMAIDQLSDSNWEYIGMDHFARPWDELALARKKGELHRNFQGFSTKAGLEMMAFGMSGISQLEGAYLQRPKDVRSWKKSVEKKGSQFVKGYFLSSDDFIRKHVIMEIMCSGRISWNEISKKYGVDSEFYFKESEDRLQQMEAGGLLINGRDGFIVTFLGRLFLRNIAMIFDAHLSNQKSQNVFSKTI